MAARRRRLLGHGRGSSQGQGKGKEGRGFSGSIGGDEAERRAQARRVAEQRAQQRRITEQERERHSAEAKGKGGMFPLRCPALGAELARGRRMFMLSYFSTRTGTPDEWCPPNTNVGALHVRPAARARGS